MSTILNCPKYSQFKRDLTQHNREQKKRIETTDAQLMSVLLQDEERKCVETAMNVFIEDGRLQPTAYIYDGFHISSTDHKRNDDLYLPIIQELFKKCESAIEKEHNYKLTFVVKDFCQPLEPYTPNPLEKSYFRFANACDTQTYSELFRIVLDGKVILNWNDWYIFENGVWKPTNERQIEHMCRDLVYNYIEKMTDTANKQGKSVLKFAGTRSNMIAAIKTASTYFSRTEIKWDDKPHLLNARNGTYNLDTNELQPHNPDDYLTLQIPMDIDVSLLNGDIYNSTAELFDDWLSKKSDNNSRDKTNYFLNLLAYCLHGNNSFQKALVLIGKLSRNGKSSFIDLLANALGDYCYMSFPFAHFTEYDKNADAPKPQLLKIKGVRFVGCSECETGNDVKIMNKPFKELTGKDTLSGRDLYGGKNQVVVFKPQATLLMVTNDTLNFQKKEQAIFNRLCHIDFPNWYGNSTMTGWNIDSDVCKSMIPTFSDKMRSKETIQNFLHTLLFLRKSLPKHYQDITVPQSVKNFEKEEMDVIDNVRSWCSDYLVSDLSDFCKEKDMSLMNQFGDKLDGKQRMIPLDYLYSLYKKDVNQGCVNERDFMKRISIIYNDIYDSSNRTKIFGGSKRYLPYLRYNEYNDTVL